MRRKLRHALAGYHRHLRCDAKKNMWSSSSVCVTSMASSVRFSVSTRRLTAAPASRVSHCNTAAVLGGILQAVRCKEILGIARRCADKCADINIPVSFFQQFQMICRALDLYFDSDFLQRCLCTLREKRQFLAARIREPADGQAFSVFST